MYFPQALQDMFKKAGTVMSGHIHTPEEINDMLARTDDELELFSRMDEDAAAANANDVDGAVRPPLMTLEEVPEWVKAPAAPSQEVSTKNIQSSGVYVCLHAVGGVLSAAYHVKRAHLCLCFACTLAPTVKLRWLFVACLLPVLAFSCSLTYAISCHSCYKHVANAVPASHTLVWIVQSGPCPCAAAITDVCCVAPTG